MQPLPPSNMKSLNRSKLNNLLMQQNEQANFKMCYSQANRFLQTKILKSQFEQHLPCILKDINRFLKSTKITRTMRL